MKFTHQQKPAHQKVGAWYAPNYAWVCTYSLIMTSFYEFAVVKIALN